MESKVPEQGISLPLELYYVIKDKLPEPVRYQWKVNANWESNVLFNGRPCLYFYFEIYLVLPQSFMHGQIYARFRQPFQIQTLKDAIQSTDPKPITIETEPSCCETPVNLLLRSSYLDLESDFGQIRIEKDHPQFEEIDRDIRQALANVFLNEPQ
jgi:hypothetical protein